MAQPGTFSHTIMLALAPIGGERMVLPEFLITIKNCVLPLPSGMVKIQFSKREYLV
jgi:hypothetical protein